MPAEKKHEILIDGDAWDERVFKNKHECINDWLRSKNSTGKSQRTLNAYSRTHARFFHEHFPDTHPSEVRRRPWNGTGRIRIRSQSMV